MESPEFAVRAHLDVVRAAVSAQGAGAIAERLAAAIRGWVLLLDEEGALRAAAPDSARAHLPRMRAELPPLARGGRLATVRISRPGLSASMRRITVAGRTGAYMAVGRSSALDAMENSLADAAAALIASDLQRRDEVRRLARNDRLAVFDLLVRGHLDVAAATADLLHLSLPEGPLRVAVLEAPRPHGAELLEAAEGDMALRRITTVIAVPSPGRVGIVLPEAEGDLRTLQAILRQVPHARGAVSDPIDAADLPEAWRQVRSMMPVAADSPGKLSIASDLVDTGVMKFLTGPDAEAWAEATLAPIAALERGSKVDYRETIRTYLANNGRADASARSLDIHRHTLRYRISQVAAALGRDLDDPTVRSELWFALQVERHD